VRIAESKAPASRTLVFMTILPLFNAPVTKLFSARPRAIIEKMVSERLHHILLYTLAATAFRRLTEPDSAWAFAGAKTIQASLPFFQTWMLAALVLPPLQECSPKASLPNSGKGTC